MIPSAINGKVVGKVQDRWQALVLRSVRYGALSVRISARCRVAGIQPVN